MCGIAGIIRVDASVAMPVDRETVRRMMDLERHRGPDDEGLFAEGPAVLGHVRLSIIDLSAGGHQPMANETGSIRIVYNGEIYNYRELRADLLSAGHTFRGSSDTEAILHGYEEWGIEGILKRLRGMFAFAIYDSDAYAKPNGEPFFFAARDRLGIKPLYYSTRKNALAFASEAKAIARSGFRAPEADAGAVATFLSFGSVSSPRTWLKGVECLAPGHYLSAGRAGVKISKFWELSYGAERDRAQLGETLGDAVQRHMIADVPVGVFLSGGVDSAAVALLANRGRSSPVHTLTIAFAEREFNEADQARAIAKQIGTEHHEIAVSARDFSEELPKLLAAADQPTADGINTYFVSRAALQLGLKAVLSGLGGDEIFFGYAHYRALVSGKGALGEFSRSSALVRGAIGLGASLYGRTVGQEKWQRFDYCRHRSLHEGLYLLVRGFFPPAQVCDLLGMSTANLDDALEGSFEPTRVFGENGHMDPNRFHYIEMRRYLHDQLLRDSDVFSMAHSIELRVPLLDNEVVDAGCRIPPREKISTSMNKPNLVEALDHPGLREAASRTKRGFTFPFATWMLQQADDLEARALEGGMLDRAAVRRCWRHFRDGRLHWSRAWSTVVLSALAENNRANAAAANG
jgi:asparagine synthase (glutamine-hydrolysing)